MTGEEDEDYPEPEEPAAPPPQATPRPLPNDAPIGCSCVTGDCEEWRTRGKRRA